MLASRIGKLLREKGLTISLAESCTGGRLGDKITDIAGSSDYFMGGVISYSNASKVALLGVSKTVLAARGAVSKEVALQMARGAMRRFHTDIGVGITGIAGPTGGSDKKPVGLVFIAVISGKHAICTRNLFKGSRTAVKAQATAKAVKMVERFVRDNF